MTVPEVNKPTPIANPVYDSAPNSPAKETVKEIFTVFDPDGTGKIDDAKMYRIDRHDGNSPPEGTQSKDKTLSVWDIKKAIGYGTIDPKDATKTMSQKEFVELIGGKTFPEIKVTKDDAIKKLSTDDEALKKVQAFLSGKVKPTTPEKKESLKAEIDDRPTSKDPWGGRL